MKQCLQAFLRVLFCSEISHVVQGQKSSARAIRGFWRNSRSFELALPLCTCTGATIAWSCFSLAPDRPSAHVPSGHSLGLFADSQTGRVFCERSKVCGWAQHLGAGTCPRPSLWVSPSVLGASPQLGMKVSAARCIFCMPGFPSLVLLPCFPVMFSPMAQDPPC